MKKYLLLTALLCAGRWAGAQYIYFNNVYEVDSLNGSLNYKILKRENETYLNVGHMVEFGIPGIQNCSSYYLLI